MYIEYLLDQVTLTTQGEVSAGTIFLTITEGR